MATILVVTPPVTVAMRIYYSSYHLHAATVFAQRAAEIENGHTGAARFDIELRTAATSATIMAVAFLEAAANEFYEDVVVTAQTSYVGTPSEAQYDALHALWRPKNGRDLGLLKKYQRALVALGYAKFAEDEAPYEETDLLAKLRNALVHYRPSAGHESSNAPIVSLPREQTDGWNGKPLVS